jgi:hypothetical protein
VDEFDEETQAAKANTNTEGATTDPFAREDFISSPPPGRCTREN